MGNKKHLRFFISIFSLLLSTATLEAKPSVCESFFRELADDQGHQPVPVVFQGKEILFHNRQLAEIFVNGPSLVAVQKARDLLIAKGGLQIPLDSKNFIVAANSRGSYTRAIWARDSARSVSALALPQRRAAMVALLTPMMSPLNRELFILNIRNPHVHMMSSEHLKSHIQSNWSPHFEGMAFESKMFVPHVRFLLSQLEDPSVRPEMWNMKQNDGLALVLIEGLRSLKYGLIDWKDLNADQAAYFGLAVSYFMRTHVWEQWDAGTWEEHNGRRTSSVGLATDALIIFQESGLRAEILEKVKSHPSLPADVKQIVEDSLKRENVQRGIEAGKHIVYSQLDLGEAPTNYEKLVQGQRFSDSALAHLLWYMPTFLKEEHFRQILSHLDSLQRESGVIRYDEDVYLSLGQFLPEKDLLPLELHKDRKRRVKVSEVEEAFKSKNARFLRDHFGTGFEAQWNLATSMKVQALAKLIELFPQSSQRKFYKDHLNREILRMFATTTGEDSQGRGPLAMDGLRVGAFMEPEAWIPVRFYKSDGSVQKHWIASKFTNLTWAAAEKKKAIDLAIESLKSE